VLALGSSESSITVVRRGSMCLIRPLTVSGNGLTQAIANYHKIDFLKAEGIKRNEGLKDSGSLCRLAVSSQLEGLIVDLEHTFKFFSHQLMKSQGPSSYDRVILCGGPAALAGLDKFLAERLGVPVEIFNPLDGAEENAHSFAAAMGMAIRYASNE
ncbi:MAG: pilus assembly protein PilM, partial [Candidatus Omnitrophota bacterium]|nr:pilus assembly protein PilM [Candidatus Omnitrophota bacterium]